ncbi:hypothetical protein LINPERHAP2_LOCUS4264 [Linum perenne]
MAPKKQASNGEQLATRNSTAVVSSGRVTRSKTNGFRSARSAAQYVCEISQIVHSVKGHPSNRALPPANHLSEHGPESDPVYPAGPQFLKIDAVFGQELDGIPGVDVSAEVEFESALTLSPG